jgi:hypothetical protein
MPGGIHGENTRRGEAIRHCPFGGRGGDSNGKKGKTKEKPENAKIGKKIRKKWEVVLSVRCWSWLIELLHGCL